MPNDNHNNAGRAVPSARLNNVDESPTSEGFRRLSETLAVLEEMVAMLAARLSPCLAPEEKREITNKDPEMNPIPILNALNVARVRAAKAADEIRLLRDRVIL